MAGEYTLFIGDTESWGTQGRYFYGALRVHYVVTYYPESNQSFVMMTPQFWANANPGDVRFFNFGGYLGNYAAVYGNGEQKFVFGTSLSSGNFLTLRGNADHNWGDLSQNFGMAIQHDSNGDASFTTAIYCSAYPMAYGESGCIRALGNTTSTTISVHANAPFSITYNANGGSGAPASQGVYVGVSYTLSSTTPTRSGYTFLGWSTSNTATTASYTGGQSVTPNGNLALYAVWKKATYTVSYNANGGTGAPAAQTKTHDVALTLSSTRPTKASASAGSYTVTYNAGGGSVSPATATCNRTTNYNFSKWNTAANGSGTNFNAGASYTANANATLYAQYTATTVAASTTLPTPVKSGFSFNGWYTAASGGTKVGNGGASYPPTATITLYAQWTALASTISTCPSSAATNSSVTLTVNRASTAYHHKVTFKKGSTTLDAPSAVFATSLTYTIPRSWFNGYPNDTSLSVTVSVQTYTDSTATTTVGSAATTTMTVTADAAIKPTVTSGWASATYYNTGTAAAAISGYVKGYSKARVSFDPSKITMANNATISSSSYSIACQGTTDSSSPYETPALTSTSVPIVCTVTDSRGRTASQTLTVSVMDYSAPSITGVSVFRCDASMTADDDGTYLCVKASKVFSSLNNQNACTLKVAYAAAGGSYGSATDLANNNSTRLGTVSPDISYTIKFTAKDSLNNEATYFATVPTRKWAMKFRSKGNGVAFGKAAETDNVFEVTPDWTVKLGTPLPVTSGGTGADTAAGALTNIGGIRPNLLDNWYFVGGGSQRGVGALPINSKGQSSYSSLSGTTCIDGWSGHNNLDVTLATGGTLISGSATSPFPALIQFTKLTSEEIRGRTLTLTVALGTGIVTATGDIPNSPATYTNYLYTADATQHCIIQFYLNSSGKWAAQISSNQASGITLYAAKLEIGSTQSLAHYENGAWVLNEMPLYAVELLKCSDSGNTVFVDTSYYRKMGNLCVLTFRSSSTITTGATNEWKSLGTLPIGYRPTDRTYGVVGAGSYNGTYYATVKIEAFGDVSVCCVQAANVAYLAGTVTFFTSQ